MIEERENTIQVEFTTETMYPEETIISGALGTLIDRFGWERRGKFVVIIEFYPDTEDEVEDE